MPGMTGTQLVRELQAHSPQVSVVLYSGFNEGISREEESHSPNPSKCRVCDVAGI